MVAAGSWVRRCLVVAGWSTLAAADGGPEAAVDVPTPRVLAQAPIDVSPFELTFSGFCDAKSDMEGLTFRRMGKTKSGAPWYQTVDGGGAPAYLYWDPDCAGSTDGTPRWVIDSDRPDERADRDLDHDMGCNYQARINSLDKRRPPLSGMWSMDCHDGWRTRFMVALEKTTTTTTRSWPSTTTERTKVTTTTKAPKLQQGEEKPVKTTTTPEPTTTTKRTTSTPEPTTTKRTTTTPRPTPRPTQAPKPRTTEEPTLPEDPTPARPRNQPRSPNMDDNSTIRMFVSAAAPEASRRTLLLALVTALVAPLLS